MDKEDNFNSRVEAILKTLKRLVQYRKMDEEQLREIAILKAKEQEIDVIERFKNSTEKKHAKALFHKYIADYTIETISDKNTLGEVIYLEVVQKRLQDKINDMYDKDKAVPINFLELMHKNSDAIIRVKNTLGITKTQETLTGYDALTHLMERHKIWMGKNQASRELKCPHCLKLILLKMRTNIWEAQKHPFFQDSRLFNKHLFRLWLLKTITKEDVAMVLETSPDYVEWMDKQMEGNPEYEEMKNEEDIKDSKVS